MLRRVVQALRVALVITGLSLLAVWPYSHYHCTIVSFPAAGFRLTAIQERLQIHAQRVSSETWSVRSLPLEGDSPAALAAFFEGPYYLPARYYYAHHNVAISFIAIPFWLLAFLCLAWPVTSFVIARRRRRGQGLPVEAKADSAVSTVDS